MHKTEMIDEKSNLIIPDPFIRYFELLNTLPFPAAILDKNRNAVFSNYAFFEKFGKSSVEEIFGKKPGELFSCVNENSGHCGSSNSCKVCGALRAIEESRKTGKNIKKEFRISSIKNGFHSNEYQVSASPVQIDSEYYTILTLNDISHEKRRRALEKIFFHDLINKAGSLSGFIDVLNHINDTKEIKEYLQIIGRISEELTEEILAQKALLAAENNDLELDITTFDSRNFLEKSVSEIMFHQVAENKYIQIDKDSVNVPVKSDERLLRRVMGNMLKNAFESTDRSDLVIAGCYSEKDKIVFWVHNKRVMPEEIRLQVFQRSFSTRGTNRGLGTYSIKLLGENYLRGKVWFRSEEGFGTRFYIELPLV